MPAQVPGKLDDFVRAVIERGANREGRDGCRPFQYCQLRPALGQHDCRARNGFFAAARPSGIRAQILCQDAVQVGRRLARFMLPPVFRG